MLTQKFNQPKLFLPALSSTKSPRLLGAATLIFAALCSVSSALDINRWAITWTLSGNPTHGTYANGDPWVVGPVTITNISPPSVSDPRIMHGSMLNPMAGLTVPQGFDSGSITPFNPSLNVGRPGGNALSAANPLVITSGSLLSSQSVLEPRNRPQVRDISILTVVSAPPPKDSFRPPYCGSDKTHQWSKSQLDYSALRSFAPVASTPGLATVERMFERPWIEINTQNNGAGIHPINNQQEYGRDIGYQISDALLSLHLNYSNEQKEELLIRVVQYGLDVYGSALNGGYWQSNGGHNQGRKAPMLFAGRLLNDANILQWGDKALHNIFQCDLNMFYVSQYDVDLPRYTADGRRRDPYLPGQWQEGDYYGYNGMIGMPEWGSNHPLVKSRAGSNWASAYYRLLSNSALVGGVLAIKLTGLESAWNNPVVFDYFEKRYVPIETPEALNSNNSFQLFHANMWKAYGKAAPSPDNGATAPNSPSGLSVVQHP